MKRELLKLYIHSVKKGGKENRSENKIKEIIYNYDDLSDTFGIKVTDGFHYEKTVEMDDGLLLDFDENNVPVSLEILDASKRFNLPKKCLKKVVFLRMDVFVDDKFICLNVLVGVRINNIENKQKIDSYASNYCNLPNMDVKLALI